MNRFSTSMAVYCPKCGAEMRDGVKYCPKCGGPAGGASPGVAVAAPARAAGAGAEKIGVGGADASSPTPGELAVLKAVREGARKRRALYKSFGKGATKEQVDRFVDSCVSKGFLSESGGGFLLSDGGLEAALKLELERPNIIVSQKVSKWEVVTDKAVGGSFMGLGVFFIYTGFNLAMQVYGTQSPQLASPSLSPSSILAGGGADLGKSLFDPINQLFSSYIVTGFKLAGAFLVISVGGTLMSKGIQLFRR